ncbi:hypothetical protein [Saccharomonospora saliphila]|uniref:hypothetical protein n=1 Tax=Saccharomonospora saliphila TaxID=369829 RepID=UPI0003764818|nr:hypothetical protein [Saccharomonospora saliphila]
MATTLPVPIEFSLPEGWRSVPPDEVGAERMAFVAVHRDTDDGFAANVTVHGELRDQSDTRLADVAAEAVERLRQEAIALRVGRQNHVGTADAPGFTQVLQARLRAGGVVRDLVQFQTFLGLRDQAGSGRFAVLHIVLTATPSQFAALVDDFESFLSTIRADRTGATGARKGV